MRASLLLGGGLLCVASVVHPAESCVGVNIVGWDFGFEMDPGIGNASAVDVDAENFPWVIVVDSKGVIYVGDSVKYRVVSFDRNGKHLRDIQMQPPVIRKPSKLGYRITALAVDVMDNVYVMNRYESRIEIYTPDGRHLRNISISFGDHNRWEYDAMYVDADGNVYVTNQIDPWYEALYGKKAWRDSGIGSVYSAMGRPIRESVPESEWPKLFDLKKMVGYGGYYVRLGKQFTLYKDGKEVAADCGCEALPGIPGYIDRYGSSYCVVYGIVQGKYLLGNNRFVVVKIRPPRKRSGD
jgi:hypothetical protein